MTKKRSMPWAILPIALLLFASCAVSVVEDRNDQQKSTAKAGLNVTAVPAVNPFDMIKRLGKGINLGNTLDAPTEGSWAAPAQEYYFDDYKTAGFNSVRIPVTWDKHLGTSYPYTVDAAFMTRVTQIVDWALARNLAVVLNCHHEDWIRTNYPAAMVPRLESLWTQIAANFANKSENLVFEIMNEPFGNITKDQVNDMNSRILNIIRQSNPTRNVIISGRNWNDWPTMISEVAIPNDANLIANFHYYDPWSFCGEIQGTWGTAQDKAHMAEAFTQIKNWSIQKNIPIYAGEYGVRKESDAASRSAWYKYFCEQARNNGFAYIAWDDSGWFGIYNRNGRTFEADVLNSIMGPVTVTNSTAIPGKIEAESYNAMSGIQTEACAEGTLNVGWIDAGDWMEYSVNVSESAQYEFQYRVASIAATGKVQLSVDGAIVTETALPSTTDWQTWTTVKAMATLSSGKHTIKLTATAIPWNLNYINVVKVVVSSSSQPISSKSSSSVSSQNTSVSLSGINLPAKIEAENYTTMSGIQTEACAEGTLDVGWVDAGDWIEFKIVSSQSQAYNVELRTASVAATGAIDLLVDGAKQITVAIPNTGGWQTWTSVNASLNLTSGSHTLRVFASGSPWNLNYINITTKASSTSSVVSSSSAPKSSSSAPVSSSKSSAASKSSSSTPVLGGIKIQAYNGSTAVSGNQIYPRLNLVNTGTSAIALSTVKVRYYYTSDGSQAQQFWCDWTPAGTANVTSSFIKIARPNADTYLEVGFTGGAGNINPGQAIEVQARVAKSDWSNFDQSNDYSFNPTGSSYSDSPKICAFVGGSVVWGVEP